MSLEFAGRIVGGKELEAALLELPKSLQKPTLESALKKAAKPVLADAKSGAPGDLKKALAISTTLSKNQRKLQLKTGAAEVFVGATWPKGAAAHLVEFGTAPHPIPKKGNPIMRFIIGGEEIFTTVIDHPGAAPHPFLRPAWDANRDRVLDSIEKEIWEALRKKAQTLARKAAAGTLGKRTRIFLGG